MKNTTGYKGSKVGNTSTSNYKTIKHSKEGTNSGTNTLQDMINVEKGTKSKEK